nr:hypothetical protein [Bacillus cereus]
MRSLGDYTRSTADEIEERER